MRFLLILLVLANLALLWLAHDTPEPTELPPPVAADNIVLLKSLADGEALPAAPAPPAAPQPVCLEWGPINDAQLDNARSALSKLAALESFREIHRQGPPRSWLVSLEGFSSRSSATNRANELRRQHIDDISIIDAGDQFALSLGVFSSEQGAQTRASTLTDKKISNVKITPRTAMANYFTVPNAVPVLADNLRDLATRFADSAVHDIPCEPTGTATAAPQ